MNKDIIGQPLEVGDTIAYTHGKTTQMFIATITSFSGSWVHVTDCDDGHEHKKNQNRVLKVTSQYHTFAEEHPEEFI